MGRIRLVYKGYDLRYGCRHIEHERHFIVHDVLKDATFEFKRTE